jgi:hypothetical protein
MAKEPNRRFALRPANNEQAGFADQEEVNSRATHPQYLPLGRAASIRSPFSPRKARRGKIADWQRPFGAAGLLRDVAVQRRNLVRRKSKIFDSGERNFAFVPAPNAVTGLAVALREGLPPFRLSFGLFPS